MKGKLITYLTPFLVGLRSTKNLTYEFIVGFSGHMTTHDKANHFIENKNLQTELITAYNYGKIKNRTNFERAKTYEDVDRFA